MGAANEVLVLGTPHLGEMDGELHQDTLQPLLQRLQRWQPQLIAIERLSGLQCDALRRQPARYADTVKSYCPEAATAAATTGLDVIQAHLEAERLLDRWPAQPTAAQRRRLAAVMLAAGEPVSALVQWLYLSAAERRAGEGLDEALAARLERLRTRTSEDSWVAAPLAVELGLQRVYSVDDHTADQPDPADPAAQEAAIRKAWDNEAARTRAAQEKALQAGLREPGGLLKLYRAYNAPDVPALAYRSDFGAALTEPSPQGYGRNYVGYWETRNLRMVAHLREVLGLHPGSRMLAIVGASHKGYYEAYLHQMHDVRLVDPMVVLKD
ncbi:DUF5694 domain-containing protein [Mitsuaria sp. WAJ17]|uniref:DUF5694 domain-containing protein n=1 Tax=Mitsuaria sp. WAJ17 TaxID=2761452 RepID=UPI00210246A0|nr:DUF5694 domain-containing protein [Mitsuaria sp. WAJ17]